MCAPHKQLRLFLSMLHANRFERIERALYGLRPQRVVLHSPLPPILLVAHSLPLSTTHRQDSWIFLATRQSESPSFHTICDTWERMGHGTGSSEQDGFDHAVDISSRLLPRDGGKTNFECGATGQGEQMARGRGYQISERAGFTKEEERLSRHRLVCGA